MEYSNFLHFLYTIENDIPDYSPTFKNISKKIKASGYKFSYKLFSS